MSIKWRDRQQVELGKSFTIRCPSCGMFTQLDMMKRWDGLWGKCEQCAKWIHIDSAKSKNRD